ncbi:beta-glucosidase [Novosphingobium barchaimii LL02]|uniref:Beta-glucosidase n=1 Tax=Novosphingobium barchaimii LL02 TaxID=1114963 RepID=A0A0J7XPH0_9SPHN|nr:glycoside hydrolase family 3 C-terminal domain-containing protein [Novosphingobium barchaimii]KMS53562.1 beta-glucosidase [Novosphingobium barchaimii LL02]
MTIKNTQLSRRGLLLASAAVAVCAASSRVSAATRALAPAPTLDPREEAHIEALIARMTIPEKVSMLSGANRFSTAAVERLGIRSMRMADGPNGVRTDDTTPASVFPASIALAATWNPEAAARVGRAIGEEAIVKDYQVVFGPAMNIQRVPVGGRNFEYFSEDPHLTGEMAVGWTKGVRSTGRLVSPKHFAANNQEYERRSMNANVSERALREIYLPAFREVVDRGDPVMFMSAYNKVNGTFASENSWLLRKVLKEEWGFTGAVMSDFGAVHSTAPAINGGLDLEMPGPPVQLGPKLIAAISAGEVTVATLDDAVRRMLRAVSRAGKLDAGKSRVRGSFDTPQHRAASRAAATEAITLVRNEDNVLPLDLARVRSIAVIGPNADVRVIQGGGSSEVNPIRAVTALDGLRAALPSSVALNVADGVDNNRYPPIADPRHFSTTAQSRDGKLQTGFWVHGGFEGSPVKSFADDVFMKFRFGDEVTVRPADNLAVRSEGWFWPPRDGEYEFQLLDLGTSTVLLDGKPIITPQSAAGPAPVFDMLKWKARSAKVTLQAGKPCRFAFEMLPAHGKAPAYRLGMRLPTGTIEQAVTAARESDVALVFVGSSNTSESETNDRASLDLFGEQNALVEAVVAANPRTAVILNNGGPLLMPWADKVPAIVEAWFLGGETGHAIADIVLGHANPSGKLPCTFPKRNEDNPTFAFYPGGLEAQYGEGIFVGYRWYDHKQIEPLFPFGHGLSYTTFAFDDLKVVPAGDGWKATVLLRNTGQRTGAEVAQLYLSLPAATGSPPRQLKRFAKVTLKPGESRKIEFELTNADLSYWDEARSGWAMAPGEYALGVGSSSRAIGAAASFAVAKEA